ncbi:MAG: hypothetical protein EPN97_17875 [Alphaproteobacteria bacterium]|nr:MAG: hypothetical protein EPN97_17875 [Alphaproteobacteria bacterium]
MPFPLNDITRSMIEKHFRRRNLAWDEAYFLNVLATSEKKHDVYCAVLALRDCGTLQAVPALKEKLHFPMMDVQATALLTIAHIARAAETPLYAAMLLDPAYRQKGYATWAIRDAADARAIDAVLEYFTRNLGKLKSGKLYNATLPDGVEYLQRHVETDKRIPDFFRAIESIWPKLAEGERKEIVKRAEWFRHLSPDATVAG